VFKNADCVEICWKWVEFRRYRQNSLKRSSCFKISRKRIFPEILMHVRFCARASESQANLSVPLFVLSSICLNPMVFMLVLIIILYYIWFSWFCCRWHPKINKARSEKLLLPRPVLLTVQHLYPETPTAPDTPQTKLMPGFLS